MSPIVLVRSMITGTSTSDFPDEEFLSEECMVTIQPLFTIGEPLRFLSHECGPFDRRSQTVVPLWVALHLQRHGKCQILPPAWLSNEFLKSKLREERERSTSTFAVLDEHVIQMATILLSNEVVASEYLGGEANTKQMQIILAEILMLRRAKIIEGLKQIDVTTSVAEITNMTSMERSAIRPQSTLIMENLRGLWGIRESIMSGETRGM